MHLASKMRSLLSSSSHHFHSPCSPLRPSPRHCPLSFPQVKTSWSPPATPVPLCLGHSGAVPTRFAATRSAGGCVMDSGGRRAPLPGEIHVIVGPMFAGKTTALLRRMRTESGSGRTIAIIKSEKDDRYALDAVVTHDGVNMPCWALSELSTFRSVIGSEAYEKLDVIGIDEAQFFGDLYDFCGNAADHDGKTIVVAGLDGDYLRRSFGSVIDLIPLADSVTKLTARCEVCGNRAFFTLRKTDEKQTEVIGGAAIYMPVCRQHYVSGQVVIEATRQVLEARKSHYDSHVEVASLPK